MTVSGVLRRVGLAVGSAITLFWVPMIVQLTALLWSAPAGLLRYFEPATTATNLIFIWRCPQQNWMREHRASCLRPSVKHEKPRDLVSVILAGPQRHPSLRPVSLAGR